MLELHWNSLHLALGNTFDYYFSLDLCVFRSFRRVLVNAVGLEDGGRSRGSREFRSNAAVERTEGPRQYPQTSQWSARRTGRPGRNLCDDNRSVVFHY